MKTSTDVNTKNLWGFPQLSLRALCLSALGSILITASSMYVALRMSALPWPTVFVAILSMAVLRLLGKTNIHEINIAKTGMSAGAMIAGGVAFTLPGLWLTGIFQPFDSSKETLQQWLIPKFFPILGVTLAGTLLGTLLCWLLRHFYLARLKLDYPIGQAAGETLKAAEAGGSSAKTMFGSLGFATLFTILRDAPATFGGNTLMPARFSSNIRGFSVGLEYSPMAIAIGYLIGFPATLYWFLGAILSQWLILNLAVQWGWFASAELASSFNFTAAVGLMVGAGCGIVLHFIYTLLRNKQIATETTESENLAKLKSTGKATSILRVALLVLAYGLILFSGLPWYVGILLCVGVAFATAMSATITGQTGVNPMEIFAIIVLLFVRIFCDVEPYIALLVTGVVAVACGYAGDLMNDYKAGVMLQTDPNSQMVSEIVGGVVGAFVAVLGLFAIIYQYGGVGGDTGLTAVQAQTVTTMVSGIGDQTVFFSSLAVGCVLFLCKVPAMIIGIGMLLGMPMSTAVFVGGVAQLIVKRLALKQEQSTLEHNGQLVAAGLLGGEGITGTVLAILSMILG